MTEKYKPVETNISFADASIQSFFYEEKNKTLKLYLRAWNDKSVELIFFGVIHVTYCSGSFVSEIYESTLDKSTNKFSYLLDELATNKIMKIFLIKDIDDVLISEIICEIINIQS